MKPEVEVRLPESAHMARIAHGVDRLVAWIAGHWLALFNTLVAVFIGLPFLAPALMRLGAAQGCTACTRAGELIYLIYRLTCHQLPERSFFLFGPQGVYSATELEALGELPAGLNLLQREMLRWPGAPEVGFKVAVCERDVAIYGSILLSGLLFAALRAIARRGGRRLPKLPIWAFAVLILPLAVDGGAQLVGLRESDWLLRLITGGLFGSACVWLAYPYVQEAMDDVGGALPRGTYPQTGQKTAVGV
jgi:uncharacterized membrane protein